MTRKAARELAIRLCFALSQGDIPAEELLKQTFEEEYYLTLTGEDEIFSSYPDDEAKEYISRIVRGVDEHEKEFMSAIERLAKGWKVSRISKTALSILKVAMFEVRYMEDVPDSAAINEAVELAKRYEEDETVPFVNGILGSYTREEA